MQNASEIETSQNASEIEIVDAPTDHGRLTEEERQSHELRGKQHMNAAQQNRNKSNLKQIKRETT